MADLSDYVLVSRKEIDDLKALTAGVVEKCEKLKMAVDTQNAEMSRLQRIEKAAITADVNRELEVGAMNAVVILSEFARWKEKE